MSQKTKVITTGINGLVGSKFKDLFAEKYEIINLGLDEKNKATDITDITSVEEAIQTQTEAKTILHLAAFTDVNAAFKQTDDKNGLAYRVNVIGTKNIVEMAKSYQKKLILVSTAYVFDGQKEELYSEEDETHPIEWYGQTKRWAEEVLIESDLQDWVILRIDQPFAAKAQTKPDIVQKIIGGIKTAQLYPQFTNHFFGPTYIDDFAKVMEMFVRRQNLSGIYHASGGEKWSDFDFAQMIAEKCGFNYKISAGNLVEYLKTAQRPYQKNTALKIEKLRSILDFPLKTINEALDEVARFNHATN